MALHLFVMRHAEAALLGDSDQQRPLTAQGKLQAQSQGEWLRDLNLQWDLVLVSPYLRAQQTFGQIDQIFAGKLQPLLETWPALTPYGNPQLVEDYVQFLAEQGKQNVLMISHLPLVGDIVKQLCGQNPAKFYPATIVQIESEIDKNGLKSGVKFVQYVNN